MGRKSKSTGSKLHDSAIEWIIENIAVWYALEIILIAGFSLYGIMSDHGFRAYGY